MPTIKLRNYIFSPSIIPTLVTLLLLYTMISLGLWQLDRAEYKSNLQTIIDSKKDIDHVALTSVSLTDDSWKYQRVMASGLYDAEHQVLLDNQVNNAVAGYSVFTPMMLTDDTAVLINRGWVSQGRNRRELPDVSIDSTQPVSVTGILTPMPASGIVLSDNANSYASWPAVLQYVDAMEIQSKLGYRILPVVLVMDDNTATMFEPLPVNISMRSEKHTAYAFQWFALSLTLLIIYIVTNTKRTTP